MNTNFNKYKEQMKVDAAVGNKLLKDTEKFFNMTAALRKRLDSPNSSTPVLRK